MATVKFSGQLREAIIRNANNLFTPRLEAKDKEQPVTADELWSIMFGKYKHHLDALPDFMFKKENYIIVNKVLCDNEDDNNGFSDRPITEYINLRFDFSSPRVIPIHREVSMDDGFGYSLSNWGGMTVDSRHTDWQTIGKKLLDWRFEKSCIVEEQTTFVNNTKTIINAFNTLAPALREWPALWDLLPQETRDRHLTVTEKRKKEKVELDLDIGKMNAITARAKLTGGL